MPIWCQRFLFSPKDTLESSRTVSTRSASAAIRLKRHANLLLVLNGLDDLVAFEQAAPQSAIAAFGFLGSLAGAESADEFFLLFNVGLLLFVGALLGKFFDFFLGNERGVIAGITAELVGG